MTQHLCRQQGIFVSGLGDVGIGLKHLPFRGRFGISGKQGSQADGANQQRGGQKQDTKKAAFHQSVLGHLCPGVIVFASDLYSKRVKNVGWEKQSVPNFYK